MADAPTGHRSVYVLVSRQDTDALERLQAALQPALRAAIKPLWVETSPPSDGDWTRAITRLLDEASLVLLFISEHFLTAQGMAAEFPLLLKAAHERTLPLLLVFLSPCQVSRTHLRQVRLFNDPTRSVSVTPPEDRELIWLHLGEQVQEALEGQRPEAADEALVLTLSGPTLQVLGAGWSPDGRSLAASSADSRVYLWEVATGHLSHRLPHRAEVQAIAWSPNGRHLASASIDGTAQVWDTTTGQHLLTYAGHADEVRSIAWSPDGSCLASASYDRTVQVWSATTGQRRLTYAEHGDQVDAVAWSPDGLRIASGGGEPYNWKGVSDTSVQVWSATTGQHLLTYAGHPHEVHTIAWSPDGSQVASGGVDQLIQIWDAGTGARLHAWKGHFSAVQAVAWAPDGTRLAAAYDDGPVRVWEVTTGKHLGAYRGQARFGALAVAWAPDGAHIAAEGAHHTVLVWRAAEPLSPLVLAVAEDR